MIHVISHFSSHCFLLPQVTRQPGSYDKTGEQNSFIILPARHNSNSTHLLPSLWVQSPSLSSQCPDSLPSPSPPSTEGMSASYPCSLMAGIQSLLVPLHPPVPPLRYLCRTAGVSFATLTGSCHSPVTSTPGFPLHMGENHLSSALCPSQLLTPPHSLRSANGGPVSCLRMVAWTDPLPSREPYLPPASLTCLSSSHPAHLITLAEGSPWPSV